MTTTVIVQANHGWPVDVTDVYADGTPSTTLRVEAGTEATVYIYAGRDLLIHEVQPDELVAASS